MKNIFLKILISVILVSCKSEKNDSTKKEKLFLGYEKTANLDTSKPEYHWFRKTLIRFKNDSVFIDQVPISVYKNDTLYSSSDGGFYYFKGTKTETDSQIKISVNEISCDYCPQQVKKIANGKFEKVNQKRDFIAVKTLNGLKINRTLFKEIKNSKKLKDKDHK